MTRLSLWTLVLALPFAPGCGNKCEKARALYLKQARERAEVALQSPAIAPEQRESLRAQGDQELRDAEERFADACKGLGDLDLKCFESLDADKEPSCKAQRKQLEDKIWPRSR